MEKILSEKFNTSEGLEVGLESWSRSYYQPINIRSSNYLKSEKNSKGEPKVFNQEQLDKCEYKKIIYKCINGGADRTNKEKKKIRKVTMSAVLLILIGITTKRKNCMNAQDRVWNTIH